MTNLRVPKYYFLVLLLAYGCQPETVTPNTPAYIPSDYFISYSINNVNTIVENNVSSYEWGYENGLNSDGTNTIVSPSAFIEKTTSGEAWGISIDNYQVATSEYVDNKLAVFEEMVGVGTYEYSSFGVVNYGASFIVAESGILWSTAIGNQPSTSSFSITESIFVGSDFFQIGREVRGVFNCVLFDESGNTKTITNGKFHLLFVLD